MKLVPQFSGQPPTASSAPLAKERLREALMSDRDRVYAESVPQGEPRPKRQKPCQDLLYTFVELKQFYIEHIASKAGSNP